jgi:hypothetical protein
VTLCQKPGVLHPVANKSMNAQKKMRRFGFITAKWIAAVPMFFVIWLQASVFQADSDKSIVVGEFSAAKQHGALPAGWKPLTFKKIKKHTRYALVKKDGSMVLKAESNSSASGLIRKIRIDPKEYPVVMWRWKVLNTLKKGDVTQKLGDDYPARLYITFQYDPASLSFLEKIKYNMAKMFYGEEPPSGAISYIWGSNAPKGTMTPNPYTNRVMMIVVESGISRLNTWINETRNIVQDYKKAFGTDPPVISGVAIMTDTDNTKESATAYYGDIRFMR